MSNDALYSSLAKSLARRELSPETLGKVTDAVAATGYPVVAADVCTHGICLDLMIEGPLDNLDLLTITRAAVGPIRSIEIFPEGIISPDRIKVRFSQTL